MSKGHKEGQFIFAKDAKGQEVAPGVVRKVLAYCKEAMCVVHEFEEGAVGELHSHPQTQITYVLKGRFMFRIGFNEKEVAAGDSMCKQNEVKHGVKCLEKGVLLDFFNPMREDFVKV
ncbi:MAG: cupin domain-containing protein [Spirochaetes bacterium]|nr:cupin domain-containing protein [Spirochaetota bacterium]